MGVAQSQPRLLDLLLVETDEEEQRRLIVQSANESLSQLAQRHPLLADSVARHNTAASAWIICHGQVYDTTKWLKDHPGGTATILKHAGTECGSTFDRMHSRKAKEKLQTMRAGRLFAESDAPALVLEPSEVVPGGPRSPQVRSVSPLPVTTGTPMPSRTESEPKVSADADAGEGKYRVLACEAVSSNTKRIKFAYRGVLPLQPGGHMTVIEPNTGRAKSYTPYEVQDGNFSMVVKAYAGGCVSGYLCGLKQGDFVEMEGPREPNLWYPEHRMSNIVLIGGGTGIAPIYSLARDFASQRNVRSITVIGCFRDREDLLLHAENLKLAERNPASLTYYVCYSRLKKEQLPSKEPDVSGLFAGRLSEQTIRDIGCVRPSTLAIVCGPLMFNISIGGLLRDKFSMPSDRVLELS